MTERTTPAAGTVVGSWTGEAGGLHMATQRRVIPIAAFAAVVVALVVVRLVVGGSDSGEGATPDPDAPSTAPAVADELRFTDVTADAGLDQPHSDTELSGESAMTAGAAVADVDADGDLDVFLPRVGLPNRLLVNDGDGTFTDRADAAGVTGNDPKQGSSAAARSTSMKANRYRARCGRNPCAICARFRAATT